MSLKRAEYAAERNFPMNSYKVLLTSLTILSFLIPQVEAAENISMRKGISFVEDKDNGFPVIGDKLEDVHVEPGKTNHIFFGAPAI